MPAASDLAAGIFLVSGAAASRACAAPGSQSAPRAHSLRPGRTQRVGPPDTGSDSRTLAVRKKGRRSRPGGSGSLTLAVRIEVARGGATLLLTPDS